MKRAVAFSLAVALLFLTRSLPAQEKNGNGVLRISFPGQPEVFELNAPGFNVEINGPYSRGRQYLLATNKAAGVTLSVFLERSSAPTLAECQRWIKSRGQGYLAQKREVHFSDVNGMPAFEYLEQGPAGMRLDQFHLFVCAAQGNLFADIHISKVKFKAADRELLVAILNSAHFSVAASGAAAANDAPCAVRPSPLGPVMDNWCEGSRLYQAQRYQEAIAPYQKALDLEKQKPALSPDFFRVLGDNLGIAYALSGDLKHAKEVFEYGVSRDPTYPLFHYNLACAYAEMDDLGRALPELRLAYQYKQNMIPGEEFPNPRTDDSFQRYMRNPSFLDFLKSVEKQPDGKTESPGGTPQPVPENSEPPAIRGTLLHAGGAPITGAQVTLQVFDDEACAKLLDLRSSSPEDAARLSKCSRDLFTVPSNDRGEFAFAGVQPGWYAVRFLWNIEPKPSKGPSADHIEGFLVVYAAQKDVSGRYDTLSQGAAFLFDAAQDHRIQFKY